MRKLVLFYLSILLLQASFGKTVPTEKIDKVLPVRGLAIAAPSVQGVDQFLQFIEEELGQAHFNMLILRIDWNYAYESHPELRDPNPLSKEDIKKIVDVCKKNNIRLAPQINLLGHQSWAKTTYSLLREYPQFDETPHIDTERDYAPWPNEAGLYCKSYCPLHPDVHEIVFALVDELMDICEAEFFHAGMDEVFYIGDDKCPRCSGRDKAELFAGEVTKISNHLAMKDRRLMIWGDRLIDGKTAGVGLWEGSYNNTHRAIDMIPKSVFICDWHYNRAELTNVHFAMKGFDVASCPWNIEQVADTQLKNMIDFRQQSNRVMSGHFQGIVATVWSGAEGFMRSYYDSETYKIDTSVGEGTSQNRGGDARTVKFLMEEFKKLNK
ncbi:MAG: family 20 glycosylhydrolase [Proteiniphilum sp.]|jgi:hypothetical protein